MPVAALYHGFAPCPRGLETLLADELRGPRIAASEVRSLAGGVRFRADLATFYRANLESRLATRILRRIGEGPASDEDTLYQSARACAWTRYFSVNKKIRVYVTAQKSPLKSLEFATLRIKDAVCDTFRTACGQRPDVDTQAPQVRIHAFLAADTATFYLDTSGEALTRRGHKIAKVGAPLKENLAAGLLLLAGWRPGIPLFDPMCGSGTLLLEAAQMSLDDAPGLARSTSEFGFARLADFDPALWRQLQHAAAARRQPADKLPIWGADLDADALARSRQNLDHAGLGDLVHTSQGDLLQAVPPAPSGILLTNPPYGERLGERSALAAFYPKLGDVLKKRFSGWRCYFLSSDTQLPKLIGLKPEQKTPVYNGALDCRLYGFAIVAGTFTQRASGKNSGPAA